MWIKLTRPDLEPVLVNFDRLTHITPRSGGGSSLYLDIEATDKNGESKQRALAVKDSVAEVYDAIRTADVPPVAKTRSRPAK
jgi:hypothetical protein